MQSILNHLLRGEFQPLVNGDIREALGLQNLEEDDIFGTGVFNEVGDGGWYVADVAGLEVKGGASTRRLVDADTGSAGNEETPFVTGRVPRRLESETLPVICGFIDLPVHLTHGTRLDSDESSADHRRNREALRVNDLDTASRNLIGCLLGQVECVAVVAGSDATGTSEILRTEIGRRR